MKLLILLFFYSFTAMADVCICQFPREDAKFGDGYKNEVFAYKMGCKLWLAQEKKCRKRKTIDINESLNSYLDEHIRSNEKIRLGYVGHWSSSNELIDYLRDLIEPIRLKYRTPILIENTGCSSMDKPEIVQEYLSSIPFGSESYIKVIGNQTTSIGMWDKASFAFRKADLIATADSRFTSPIFPSCDEYKNRRCTGYQKGEKGFCVNQDKELKELICLGKVVKKKYSTYKQKNSKYWLDLEENKALIKSFIRQEELDLKLLMSNIGYEVDYFKSMTDTAAKD